MSKEYNDIRLPFNYTPRTYHKPAWDYMMGKEERKRAILVNHRRAGKDLFGLNVCVTKAMQRIGTYWHVLPTNVQGKKIIWRGMTKEGRGFLDYIPKPLIHDKNEVEMRITLKNPNDPSAPGSVYQVVGADNKDSLIGTNPVGTVFSEYSVQDPAVWDFVRPILAENEGWAMFLYTPRGKNHGFHLLERAKQNPKWFWQVLQAGDNGTKLDNGQPVVPDWVIDEERKSGMSEAMIRQEFYCDFNAPLEGSFYGDLMTKAEAEGRITDVPVITNLPVYTAWDWGMYDDTVIWFYQKVGMNIHIVDYLVASGQGLDFYAKNILDKPFVHAMAYVPHDFAVRDPSAAAKSRSVVLRGLGVKNKIVPRGAVADGIQQVRALLPRVLFDKTKAYHGIEALKEYHRKKLESNGGPFGNQAEYQEAPEHNWASHSADAFRTLAMGLQIPVEVGKREMVGSFSSYDPLSRK